MKSNSVVCKKDGIIAWLILNRPEKLNAINIATWREIRRTIDNAQRDAEIRVIAISGAGDAFCAGDDIEEFNGLTDVKKAHDLFLNEIYPALESIVASEKPIITAVNGLAYGGGCGLVMASDLAIASENATFAIPEARIGILPGFPTTLGLHSMGKKKILEMIFTGEPIDANEAKRIGLINKVVPLDQLKDAVKEMVERMTKSAPIPLKLMKGVINRQVGMERVLENIKSIMKDQIKITQTDDFREGVKAFLDKRKPGWRGK